MATPVFREKNIELERLKKQARRHMSEFNGLHCDYSEWFKRQQQSFVDVIKSVQVAMPTLVCQELRTIAEYRHLVVMASRLQHCGNAPGGLHRLQQFEQYWVRFCKLKRDLDSNLLPDVDNFLAGITTLRQEEVKQEMDGMRRRLNLEFSEGFDFRSSHNERSNLYTYRLMVCDQSLLGLVGYLPYLLNMAARICFLVNRVFIEKV